MTDVLPFKRPSPPQDLVLRFLTSPGHKRDAEFYLANFTAMRPESFAIIVIDDDVLFDDVDSVLFEIRYLMRLGLYPVVAVRPTQGELSVGELELVFKRAKLTSGLISCEYSDDELAQLIRQRISQKLLPVIKLDREADFVVQTTRLVNLLRSSKVLLLTKHGGIIDQVSQEPVSIINLKFDLDQILVSDRLTPADKNLIQSINTIVNKSDHRVLVAVVSANNMLRELFTVKGAGTVLQRGTTIVTHKSADSIDPQSLKRLIESNTGKTLRSPIDNKLFDFCYIEENYMGAALLKMHGDMAYLSVFAVGTEARGLGIGRDLWNVITGNHPKIFWRESPDQFITNWYAKQCDGLQKSAAWTVFWKGIAISDVPRAVEFALNQTEPF